MKRFVLLLISIAVFAVSCNKLRDADESKSNQDFIPEGFTYSTIRNVALDVRLLTNDNKPLAGVTVDIYSSKNTRDPIFTTLSNSQGLITGTLVLPAYTDTLIIDPAYVGLIRNAVALVKNGAVTGTIGGSIGFGGNIIPNDDGNGKQLVEARSGIQGKDGAQGTTTYTYLSPFDASGKPTTLAPSDIISSELLSFVNASLPERKPVPTFHPDYLTNSSETNINITRTADVWITFVSEGAGNTNSLGFYTYPSNTPPSTAAELDSIKIVLPNASLSGSGGSLKSGEKVLLGRFPPGISIGFVLFQSGWSTTNRTVNTGVKKYYSDDALNAEAAGFKRHVVLLYDDKNKLFLHGIEDLQRDNGSSDQDFNDLVFYATSNPVEAISTENVNPIDKPIDSDGDGVTDTYDKFPTDPARAYIQYYPTADSWGTLAFEDLWPSSGDYDINDLVVGYQYRIINDAQNRSIELNGAYTIYGIGASRKNGLGIQLNLAPAKVSSVSGQLLRSNYVILSANGTEQGQAKTVFFPFDDPEALIRPGTFVNNRNGQTAIPSDTARVRIQFTTPVLASELGLAPFNPFLVANMQRGHEVHLPGQKPTDKVNTALFGTQQDKTAPANNKYYLTQDNWPWALHFAEKFDYPTESNHISNVYTFFLPWARSGGSVNTDWYLDKTGYRNNALIYKR